MKKIVLLLQSMILYTFALTAQEKDSVVILPEVVVTSKMKISEQVDKSFAAKFPDATDVIWNKLNKEYLTRFMQADLKHQALFRKNGVLRYDIIYMSEGHIPNRIADDIKRAYDEYAITNAARVDRAGQVFWIINLEGINSYKVIRIDKDHEMEEVKHYLKSQDW